MYSLVLVSTFLAAANAVINGKDADIKDFPYHVSVEWPKDRFMYDGVIIHKNWVLSSGFREKADPSVLCQIRAGTNTKGQGGSVHRVDKIFRHPKWHLSAVMGIRQMSGTVNDLALIHVVDPFEFGETRRSIGLFEGELIPGVEANVTAFSSQDKKLKVIEVPVVDFEVCHHAYKQNFKMFPKEGIVCTGYDKEASNVCHYDWGAPLVFEGKLTGIASYVPDCKNPLSPVMFSEIAPYWNWIRSHVPELPKSRAIPRPRRPPQSGTRPSTSMVDEIVDIAKNFGLRW